jgi:uncharacterized protein YcbK (DUF882 family)
MNNYTLIHFTIKEFVDPETYKVRGEQSIALIDWRMLWTMDMIREYFNKPITINNWHINGNREWSGIRYSNSPYYSQYSQHSYGRAIDFLVQDIESSEVRKTIINNVNEEAFKYITTVEDFEGMEWIHIDCRVLTNNQSRYLIVKP